MADGRKREKSESRGEKVYVSFSAAESSRWILTPVCVSVLYHTWVLYTHLTVCVTALCMWRVLCACVKCICSSFMAVSVAFCYCALLRLCLAVTWWNMSVPRGIPSACWVAAKQLCACAFMRVFDSVLQKRARHYRTKRNFSPPEEECSLTIMMSNSISSVLLCF